MSVINGVTVYTYKQISYTYAVEMCKNILNEVLIPYFEKTKDIKNAHNFMLKMIAWLKKVRKILIPEKLVFIYQKKTMTKQKKF